MTCTRWIVSLTGPAIALAVWAPPGGAAALTATDVRIVDRAASVRAIVEFAGGPLTGLERQVDAPDARVADGRGIVRVNAAAIAAVTPGAERAGVRVRVSRRPGSLLFVLDAPGSPRGRLKFISYRVSRPRNLVVIDLWKATTAAAAAIRDDGCLRLTERRSGPGFVTARGLERTPIFEHNVVISLRAAGRGGATVALRPLIATGGVFRPDFSGFSRPGRWSGRLTHAASAPARVMLEAWSASAKDGSLDCLVQAPVVLRPRA